MIGKSVGDNSKLAFKPLIFCYLNFQEEEGRGGMEGRICVTPSKLHWKEILIESKCGCVDHVGKKLKKTFCPYQALNPRPLNQSAEG